MKHIFEKSGVLLSVEYVKDKLGIPTFESVRVMDSSYRPVGPDLSPFLDEILIAVRAIPGTIVEGESVLSAIAEELP